ncbi:hypothetical protein CKAN_02329300 [Cinnamomum micranthum f. kanehirae]|uniref:Uncharacterized protein n=1 Tax=Cinnamomum micranthum f. kanehirae TaxID=337451 RepID=A0A443PTD1_9MAGN|nr:hypothetical protein CKAN_02329300 [Cinnamomum micranthum f. kanehirae]
MEGSSKVFSTILMRIVFLLLLALIISPVESLNIAHEHPQTGKRKMKGSSKTLSRMSRRVVLLLLVTLIMSPVQSRQLGNEHPQTGMRDGDPQVVAVDRRSGPTPPAPRDSGNRSPGPPL